ncbi:hypothetical protein Taro_030241 [Colocasia esculenta]|uniref:Uncharacterized protein n=1 Tax=Colocasia esculenta TaxID=4460 RepID=A0A843VLZ2_COLES|nr:hypothetical protein [Colocasia esculenta]
MNKLDRVIMIERDLEQYNEQDVVKSEACNKHTMTGRGRCSAQSRRYEQNRKLKNFVKGLKPSVRAKLLELDSHTMKEILGVATKQGSRAGPLQEGEATPKEDVTKPFQRQDKKKEKLVESQQSTVTSISEKHECIQCRKRHGGNACWRKEGRRSSLRLCFTSRVVVTTSSRTEFPTESTSRTVSLPSSGRARVGRRRRGGSLGPRS